MRPPSRAAKPHGGAGHPCTQALSSTASKQELRNSLRIKAETVPPAAGGRQHAVSTGFGQGQLSCCFPRADFAESCPEACHGALLAVGDTRALSRRPANAAQRHLQVLWFIGNGRQRTTSHRDLGETEGTKGVEKTRRDPTALQQGSLDFTASSSPPMGRSRHGCSPCRRRCNTP